MRKLVFFAYAKTKTQISFALTGKLISAFVFAIRLVKSLYYLNSDISSLSHLLWLYGLCRTRSETPKTGFLITRLIYVTGFQNPLSPMKKSQRDIILLINSQTGNQQINGKTGCNNLVKSSIIMKTTTYNR